jgi:hypothetical protein
MKALRLWSPWGELLASGHKKIESRSWKFTGDCRMGKSCSERTARHTEVVPCRSTSR